MFKQLQYKGYDNKEAEKFYKQQFKLAKKRGKSDEEAHKFAEMMLEMYGHHFRIYG